MNPTSDPTPHKLGANRNELAHKSRGAKNFSESCDIHEDRGAVQSKFAHPESTTGQIRKRPRVSVKRTRSSFSPEVSASAAKQLTEHSSGPELHVIHLRLFKEGARKVTVAGTFNDWNPQQTPLDQNGKGEWEIALSLAPGDYEYRFVADGEWMDDPLARRRTPNPYGGQNALLHVHRS